MDCQVTKVLIDQFISRNDPRYLEIVNYAIQAAPAAIKASKTEEQFLEIMHEKLKIFGNDLEITARDHYEQPISIEYSDLIVLRIDSKSRPQYLH